MKELLAVVLLVSLSGTLYAEEQAEAAKPAQSEAQCTEQGIQSGLDGAELDAYVKQCAASTPTGTK